MPEEGNTLRGDSFVVFGDRGLEGRRLTRSKSLWRYCTSFSSFWIVNLTGSCDKQNRINLPSCRRKRASAVMIIQFSIHGDFGYRSFVKEAFRGPTERGEALSASRAIDFEWGLVDENVPQRHRKSWCSCKLMSTLGHTSCVYVVKCGVVSILFLSCWDWRRVSCSINTRPKDWVLPSDFVLQLFRI